MKLILSSCDFRNDHSRQVILENIPKSIDRCRVLYIPNEKATYESIHSEKFYRRLQEFGFLKENIYVLDYYDPKPYFNLDIDLLYISGGNTFKTLNRIRNCHFDVEIIRYIHTGVTYIGGSAGAHIVTQNISHVSVYDEVPMDMTDFSALGLFDGILLCHYTPDRQMHFDQLIQEGRYNVYALTDDDSIVIQD